MAPSTDIGLLVAALTILPAGVAAQRDSGRASCDGRRITAISVTPERPPFAGSAGKWRALARGFGLHHATTRPEVVRAYALLKVGDLCSDSLVTESERVLRGLPFLADATAHTTDDGSGGVVIDIRTTDEIPVLVAGSLRHGTPSALSLGNANIGGLGIRAVAGAQRGGAYRAAAHFEFADYAPFNEPVALRLQAARDPLGSHIDAVASHQFLSNAQRGAWFASYRLGDDFPIIVPQTGNGETVETHSDRWSIGGVFRSVIGPVVTLIGPVALGSRDSPSGTAIVVSDSGVRPDSNPALVARFEPFHSARLGALFGVRRVRYVSRVGLDGLFAPQDVMVGWQLGLVGAPGMASGNGRDLLVGNSAYVGVAAGRVVVIGDAETEARRDFTGGQWASTVGNVRVSAYFSPVPRFLVDIQDNYSAIGEARLPTQLSLGDPIGGPRGYIGSSLAGGRRNVTRLELRGASPRSVYGADVGLALFADVAQLWAGDVPYGVDASRQSVGASFLASFPTRSKRLYRVDVAYPLQRGQGRGLQVRFTNGDATAAIAAEPFDVTQARLAPIPASLFAWPGW
jgi:hypothetical protein